MKRDLDLCREILQALEDDPGERHPTLPTIQDHSVDEVRYHLDIMYEAGLVWSESREFEKRISWDIETIREHQIGSLTIREGYRLTWAGHEFFDAARSNTRWNAAKKTVMETTGDLAFEFLRDVLMHKGKQLLGLERPSEHEHQ